MKPSFIPAARFHLLTPLFDKLCGFVGLGNRYRKQIIKTINFPPTTINVLDAGCGTGSLAIDIKTKYQNIHLSAIDADSKMIRIAKEKSNHANQEIQFTEAFLQKLPFPNNSFDIVYSSLVFHHLKTENKKDAMKEIHRILKKDGLFLLIDFCKPKHKIYALFSWFTILFEEGDDNYQGKIPKMISDAGFKEVTEIQRYRFNISFTQAVK